jgi:hypothetical protein
MDERSIWHGALVDILSIIYVPGVQEVMPSMSPEELRRRATHMTYLDRRWYQGSLVPKKIQRHHCESNVHSVQFIQGGEWVVMMFSDGRLQLCKAHDLAEASICIPYPTTPDAHFEMGIFLTSWLVTLVHVTEKRWNSGYVRHFVTRTVTDWVRRRIDTPTSEYIMWMFRHQL